MKIGNPADKPAGIGAPAGATRTQPGEAAKAQEASSAKASDPSAKVELSKTAATLLSTESSSDFDANKVARITQAISEGKFEINAEKIADRLIANAHEVLGNNKASH